MKLIALQEEYQEEYEALTKEEKVKMVQEFEANKDDTLNIQ
jgi:hypothetical protein